MRRTLLIAIALIAGAVYPSSSSASVVVFSEDFGATTISGGHRLWLNQADTNWQASFDSAWGDPSIWQVTGGQLSNTGNDPDERAREKPAAYMTSVSTNSNLEQLNFEFDYNLGAGTTLTFHAVGLVSLAGKPPYTVANPQILNVHSQNGGIGQGGQLEENFTDINLKDGTEFTGSTATGIVSLTGSGTYSQTINIAAFASSGTTGVTKVDDLEFIAVAFGLNFTNSDGSGAVVIDNFSITAVPEPTSATLFGVLIGCLGYRRRRA